MSQNPSCDACGCEDSEHVLCEQCMQETDDSNRAAERSAIVDWLTSKTVAYGDQPKLDLLIDAIEKGEHLATDRSASR